MNEQLMFESMLLLLKSTVEVYVHGTLEASNKEIHDVLKHGLDEIMKLQFDLYTTMTEYGWYQINNVKATEINKTLKKLESAN